MNITEYIQQRFQSYGISVSEADLLDIEQSTGLSLDDEMSNSNYNVVNIGIAKFIPTLLLRATSVSESGFSMSWDMSALKNYYSYLCKKYGLKDEINTEKPKVRFL